jgi:hypothetical protein
MQRERHKKCDESTSIVDIVNLNIDELWGEPDSAFNALDQKRLAAWRSSGRA